MKLNLAALVLKFVIFVDPGWFNLLLLIGNEMFVCAMLAQLIRLGLLARSRVRFPGWWGWGGGGGGGAGFGLIGLVVVVVVEVVVVEEEEYCLSLATRTPTRTCEYKTPLFHIPITKSVFKKVSILLSAVR